MTDLTLDAICARHPDKPSVGSCDCCGRSYCGECRVEDIAAERLYCSLECRDGERRTQSDSRPETALLEGYDHPIATGARSWLRSLPAVATALGPLAAAAAVLTWLLGGFTAQGTGEPNSVLVVTLLVLGLFGMALTGVVVSQSHTGYAARSGSSTWLYTLRRFVPWILTWLLMLGLIIIGYLLLAFPGVYLNMRLFWADEFALAHRVNPLTALDESWSLSRGEVGRTFNLEFVLGGMLTALVVALVLALSAMFVFMTATSVPKLLSETLFAGVTMVVVLSAYGLVHSMQVARFYGLRARLAQAPVSERQRHMPRALRWVSVPAAVVVAAILGFSTYLETGSSPSLRVLAGEAVPEAQYRALVEQQIVSPAETIEYFYSEGILSVLEGGSVLTDRRLIAYEQNDSGSIDIYEMAFEEMAGIELVQKGDALNYSIYKVLSSDAESWVVLFLPHEQGDDRRFIAAVEAKFPE